MCWALCRSLSLSLGARRAVAQLHLRARSRARSLARTFQLSVALVVDDDDDDVVAAHSMSHSRALRAHNERASKRAHDARRVSVRALGSCVSDAAVGTVGRRPAASCWVAHSSRANCLARKFSSQPPSRCKGAIISSSLTITHTNNLSDQRNSIRHHRLGGLAKDLRPALARASTKTKPPPRTTPLEGVSHRFHTKWTHSIELRVLDMSACTRTFSVGVGIAAAADAMLQTMCPTHGTWPVRNSMRLRDTKN